MPPSLKTFRDEYDNLSPIPGVFVETKSKADEFAETEQLLFPASTEATLTEATLDAKVNLGWEQDLEEVIDSNNWRRGEFEQTDVDGQQSPFPRPVWSDTGIADVQVRSAPLDYADLFNQSSDQLTQKLLEVVGVDVRKALDELLQGTGSRAKMRIPAGASAPSTGTEAYGCFAPYHYFHKHPNIHWGIYLYIEPIIHWAARLYLVLHHKGETISFDRAFHLIWFTVFRHELFHYHVELFATRQEVAQRKPVYLPYKTNVFGHPSIRDTEDWLEEALAQAVVLRSNLVSKKIGVGPKKLKAWLEKDFATFGNGYKHFACKKYKGTANAHRVLAAQIVTGQQNPGFATTNLLLPLKEYVNRKESVPAFLAARPTFLTRFQLAGPKRTRWKRYAKKKGFTDTRDKMGDHEIWIKGKQRVQINFKRGEADRASMKAVASITGQDLRTLLLEAARA